MMLSSAADGILRRYPDRLLTIDSHTAGEPTRLIVDGVPPIPGETMNDKRLYLKEQHDEIRLQLTREPRGHQDMVAALVTQPVTPHADFGLIYMDARYYPYLCGHATIGAVTTLIEAGVIRAVEPDTRVVVDTPSGPVETHASVKNGKVTSVAIQLAPSFVYGQDLPLEVPGLGRIRVDTVCVGGFFAMVSADQIDLELSVGNAGRLAELGMAIMEAANDQLSVADPTRPEVQTVDVTEFYAPLGARQGKSVVVYGESHVDRSPCGTGTSAKMALLHRQGKLGLNQTYLNQGILGTTFEGRLVAEARVGELPAVIPEVRGSAYVTGVQQFFLDESDPFPEGFLLGH
jgi:proline racemase